jgi:hypothetical protein
MSKKSKIKNVASRKNSVERFVARWANNYAGYDNGAIGPLQDLARGGCSSGMVGSLIYTVDIEKFFKAHCEDIFDIVEVFEADMGEPMQRSKRDYVPYSTFFTWAAIEIVGANLLAELEGVDNE